MYERLYSNGRAYMRPADRSRTSRVVKGWGRDSNARHRQRPASSPELDQPANSVPATGTDQPSLF